MSTTYTRGVTKYYRNHFNQWCCAERQISDRKLLPRSVYDVLTQISNDFQLAALSLSRQTIAVVMRRVRCRCCVTPLSRRNKATSAYDRRPSAPWVLSSAEKLIRYLHGSYFLSYHFADVSAFVFYPPSLSVNRLGCSPNALSSTSWVDTPLTAEWLQVWFWYSAPTQCSKALKSDIPHL